MAEAFFYLTTTGRVSGLPRKIEIWFVQRGEAFYVVAERREQAQWVKNLVADGCVTFSVGTRANPISVLAETSGRARTVDPHFERELARDVCALMDEKYGWSDGLIVEIARAG